MSVASARAADLSTDQAGTTPEARFVTLCVRESDAASVEEIRRAALELRSWPKVAELAARHGVAAFVRQSAGRSDVPIPADADAVLRSSWASNVAQVMSLNLELERVVRSFAEDQIPVIVLKGPALASTIYPTPTLRLYGDVDLTVHEEDDDRAAATLRRNGFDEIPFEVEVARLAHADHGADEAFHRLFRKKPQGLLFELHVDPLQLGLRPACEAGRWERAVPMKGLPGARALGSEDQLVHLSVHAHKHGFSRLIWLKDLELLLRTAVPIRWDLVNDVAEREGVRSSVWYAVHLAARLLEFPVPEEIQRMRPSPFVRLLYRLVWPEERVTNLAGRPRWRSVQFRVADSWRGMIPSLVLMGRRRDRARAIARALWRRPPA